MNTNELDSVYIGSNEVTKLYLGADVVWEKGMPEDFNWEARFNLSYDGATDDDVIGANIIRPVPSSLIIPNPTAFGTILDTNGNTLPISVQMTGSNTRADVGETTPPSNPDSNLYRQRWWNNGNWFIDFSGLDDTKRYTAQLVSYESGSTEGQVITTVTYRKGANATNLSSISADASDPNPVSYEFSDQHQIRHDELLTDGGAMRLIVQRNGSVARSVLSYIVLKEYDIVIDGVQTLQVSGVTSSPLPFVEYVPNGTGLKPAFIFLHGSGERGNGSAGALSLAMRYGPNASVVSGTFKKDAYAFTPQIPVGASSYWQDQHQLLSDYIDWLLLNYNIDPAKVYLIGYSDGALGIGAQVSRHPGKIAAGVCIGYDPMYYGGTDYPEWIVDPELLKDIPIWVFKNRYDPSSYGFQNVVDGVAAVNALNPSIEPFTVFNDYTHEYAQKICNGTGMGRLVDGGYDPFNQDIYDWLLSH